MMRTQVNLRCFVFLPVCVCVIIISSSKITMFCVFFRWGVWGNESHRLTVMKGARFIICSDWLWLPLSIFTHLLSKLGQYVKISSIDKIGLYIVVFSLLLFVHTCLTKEKEFWAYLRNHTWHRRILYGCVGNYESYSSLPLSFLWKALTINIIIFLFRHTDRRWPFQLTQFALFAGDWRHKCRSLCFHCVSKMTKKP